MLVGFKRQFAPYVEEGSKTHTIRGAGRFKVGQRLDCYVDPRQKSMRLLGRWPCVNVEQIIIETIQAAGDFNTLRLEISGITLSADEAIAFAFRDGFRPVRACDALVSMKHFWERERKLVDQPGHWWDGEIGHWDFSRPMVKR